MKLIGKLIVSFTIRLTFDLLLLFCIPIIKIKNKLRFKEKVKKTLFNNIFISGTSFTNIVYKQSS